MRSFRKNTENLRDTRIAYTFLISLVLVCAIFIAIVTHLGDALKKRELERCYESLALCADALEAWEAADAAEERYAQTVRFENAASGLPSEVRLEPILSLADYMRMGASAEARVRAFADTFSLLSSIDYASADDARRIIAEMLGGVSDTVLPSVDVAPEAEAEIPPEVLAYTKRVAQNTVKQLFGQNSVRLELSQGEGCSWVAETDNLRMRFSQTCGGLEGFSYIRVGAEPGEVLSEAELVSRALEFFKSTRRGVGGVSISKKSDACGFTLCEISAGEEKWHVTVDSHGRVWSLTKVKR